MRQILSERFTWEWRCDSCCSHLMIDDDDPICIAAEDVPRYYSMADDRLHVMERIHGTTCARCAGYGQISFLRFLRRPCPPCLGTGKIIMSMGVE